MAKILISLTLAYDLFIKHYYLMRDDLNIPAITIANLIT
jgi:hypothetical protein